MNRAYLFQVFSYLHAHPELSGKEEKTGTYLSAELKHHGFQVFEQVNGTWGVIGLLDSGVPGKTLALRADMDALPYQTEEGHQMAKHTCGHDGHSAMVMAAAASLSEKGIPSGKLMIVFQPAEETLSGAISMINSGLLNQTDEMIGIHIRPKEELQLGQAVCALRHAASCQYRVKIQGVSAHGARPQQGINAIEAAISMIQAIYALHADPRVSHSCKVTRFMGGGPAENLIPDQAEFTLDIRCQNNKTMEELKGKIYRVIVNVSKAFQTRFQIDSTKGVPAAEYDDQLIHSAYEAASSVLGEQNVLLSLDTPGGEDFHFYHQLLPHCKTVYLGLGADAFPGLHHKDMSFNPEALPKGAAILEELVHNRLNLHE